MLRLTMRVPNMLLFNLYSISASRLFVPAYLCIISCTFVSSTECGKLEKLPGDIRTYSPWTCAIFIRTEQNQLKFFTTGTIIGSNAVVTVARGPFGSILKGSSDSKILPPAHIFVVAAGVNSTDFNFFDRYRQLSEVNYLEPDVTGDDSNEHFHFLIFHLKTLLDFRSPYVKALCLLPEDSVNRISPTGWEFVSSGFAVNGLKAKTALLSVETIQTFSAQNCSSYYRFHYGKDYEESQVYCGKKSQTTLNTTLLNAELSNATGVFRSTFIDKNSCFLHGSVNVFEVGDRWSLGGIVVLIPERRRGKCDDTSAYIYARANQHLSWMQSSVSCGPDKFACGDSDNTCIPITMLCNSWPNCPGGKDELESLCIAQNHCVDKDYTNQTYSCGVTSNCIKKSQVCDNQIDCLDGIDEDNKFCFQFRSKVPNRSCPSLKMPRGATASCSNNATDKECLTQNEAGSKIKFYCREFFESIYWYTSFEATCDDEKGVWLNKLPFACSAECGIFPPLAKSWVDNQTFSRNLPWNGFTFSREINGHSPPLCSAVFIDSNFALTSGTCLKKWNLSPDKTFFVLEPTSIEGAVFLDPNSYIQSVTAIQFWFAADFYGGDIDLALVKHHPPERFQPGQGIPVCYLRTPQQLRNGSLIGVVGRVMHIGTGKSELQQKIEAVDFHVLSQEECAARFGPENVPHYAFCARAFGNASNKLRRWDVGTGFYIIKQNSAYGDYQFYLKGLAISPKYPVELNLMDGLQLFINTDKFLDWIIDVMENNY